MVIIHYNMYSWHTINKYLYIILHYTLYNNIVSVEWISTFLFHLYYIFFIYYKGDKIIKKKCAYKAYTISYILSK